MSNIRIQKRDGKLEILDIKKIQKQTIDATFGLEGVSQSELEIDSQIKFVDLMKSSDIEDSLIKTAVEKIDIDRPNWTFVAARLFVYDLYHRVGKTMRGEKGHPYAPISKYYEIGEKEEKLHAGVHSKYDLEKIDKAIDPSRDFLFNYLGIKTLYDRYLIKNSQKEVIELPQHMFMAIAMFLAQEENHFLTYEEASKYSHLDCNSEEYKRAARTSVAIAFYDVISKFEVMLATPTLSNARTNRHQLSSCYIGCSPDNIEGIFDAYKEKALLSKFGGGIGWDWTQIRAMKNSIAGHSGAAGGYVPFLKIENDLAIAVDQLGTRRGAIAVYSEPWHMDILDFLDLKKNSGEERRRTHDLFPALWITDLFMERVEANEQWTLFSPNNVPLLTETYGEEFKKAYIAYEQDETIPKEVLNAKDIWKKVLTQYFETGNPFLAFKDTANRANPNPHTGLIRSSNLCTEIFQNTSPNKYKIKIELESGEIVLFEEEEYVEIGLNKVKKAKHITALDKLYGQNIFIVEKEKFDGETAVCNLGSVNLSKINSKEDLQRVIPILVRMLDNVIDLNFYPLRKVKATNLKSRAIGLGVMGEAQMLAEKGILYGTQEHLNLIDEIMDNVSYETIMASSKLAEEKGSYPTFNGSNWSKGIMPFDHANQLTNSLVSRISKNNWETLRETVKTKGLRNGYLMAIAPTSSISILVGTTQAIEPVYKKKWFEENLSGLIPVVVPNLSPDTWNYYPSAYDTDPFSMMRAGAIRQKWIDQGQSLNMFLKLENVSGKMLNDLYIFGWKLGLKSNYYLRSQSPDAKKAEMDVADRKQECEGCQ